MVNKLGPDSEGPMFYLLEKYNIGSWVYMNKYVLRLHIHFI